MPPSGTWPTGLACPPFRGLSHVRRGCHDLPMSNRTRPVRTSTSTAVEKRLNSFSILQTSARAAGICPACTGAARVSDPSGNGDSWACEGCDGTGAWSYWVTLTGGGWRFIG